jgi:hypothetical protein
LSLKKSIVQQLSSTETPKALQSVKNQDQLRITQISSSEMAPNTGETAPFDAAKDNDNTPREAKDDKTQSTNTKTTSILHGFQSNTIVFLILIALLVFDVYLSLLEHNLKEENKILKMETEAQPAGLEGRSSLISKFFDWEKMLPDFLKLHL